MKVLYTSNSKIRFILKTLVYLFLSVGALIIFFELYNPLATRNNKVFNDLTSTFRNEFIPELPKTITVSYNNIGYLGENWSDTIKRQKVLFIGSSTTQSFYIPYEYKWTTQAMHGFNCWYNNCGVDGADVSHWMKEIDKLSFIHPNYVVVMVNPFPFEEKRVNNKAGIKNLEIVKSVVIPYYQSLLPDNKEIGHRKTDWNTLETINKTEVKATKSYDYERAVQSLDLLVSKIKSINAIPILISQPTPYGDYINNKGMDIGAIKKSIQTDYDYSSFNNALEAFCNKGKVPYINGYSLEKNNEYFYDFTHFNIEGSNAFGKLVQTKLSMVLPK